MSERATEIERPDEVASTAEREITATTNVTLHAQSRMEAQRLGMNEGDWDRLLYQIRPLQKHHRYTYEHSLRVGLYAAGLAQLRGVDARLALYGGTAHDIGKLDVPAEVLDANPFTEQHRRQCCIHPVTGWQRLSGEFLASALVSGFHHRFQSRSYGLSDGAAAASAPPALVHKAIEAAEVVAMADFYDAVTTRRNSRGLVTDPDDATQVTAVMNDHFSDPTGCAWLLANDLRDADFADT